MSYLNGSDLQEMLDAGGSCENCSKCYRISCDRRPQGLGYYYPKSDTDAGGIIGAAGTASKIAASFVPGASLFGKLISGIGSLFGMAPRGNFQKFKRTAYPYMRTLAARSGIPVCIGWFGDVVAVNPDGSFGVILEQSTGWPKKLADSGYRPFYEADCDRSDADCVNHPKDLYYRLFDPQNSVSSLQDIVLSIEPSNKAVTTLPDGSSTLLVPSTKPAISLMGIDLKSLLLWGGLFGAAYMIFTEKKGK